MLDEKKLYDKWIIQGIDKDLNVEDPYAPSDLRNNKLKISDRSFHDWYRFVLAFPPHLVRNYFDRFEIDHGATALDPFCGTGTTIVEAKKNGIRSYGLEVAKMAAFAAMVKSNWPRKSKLLLRWSGRIHEEAKKKRVRKWISYIRF